jgi:filamin
VPIVGQPAQVTINTLEAGPLPPNAVHAHIVGPSGNVQDAFVTPAPQGYHLRFNVPEPGSYVIETDVCTLPLRPVQVTAIEPLDPSKVRAYGPGLSQGTVNKPADFIVDTRGAGNGQLGVTVEGPSESKIDYQDNNDGSCRVTYHPTGSFLFLIVSLNLNINYVQLLAIIISIYCMKANISLVHHFVQLSELILTHGLFVVMDPVLIPRVCTTWIRRQNI